MDAVDGDANRANVEVLVRCRASSLATPSNTYLGAILRGSGNGTTETGYGVLVVTGSPDLRIAKYSAGTNTALTSTAGTITFAANTWYWLRARVNGTTIQGKVWADGASEPGAWDISYTDSAISAAGWSGVFGFIGGVNKDFSDIAIATNGDTAVMSTPGVVIDCGVGIATASGLPASIGSNAAIECALGTAVAAGLPATLGSAVVIQCALGSAVASGLQASLQTIFIQDDYERSSVNLAASSVAGDGDSAVITIRPRVQESEVKSSLTAWLEPSARVVGVNGVRPTLRFSGYAATWSDGTYHGTPWGTGRRPMFSYDRLTWTYFDTQTINSTYIEFRHNTAFTSDTVYISRERQVSVTQTGEWLDSLAAAHPTLIGPTTSAAAFTPTLTAWPAQQFISNEYSSQTNELGATIPATPFYAAEINDTSLVPDSGAKRVAVITSGVHAGEDTGNWAMMRAVEYLLGSSAEAQNIRRNFRILLYPMVNAPGRHGGGWRGSFTQGTSGADDANRHFNETGSALEIVDKPKAALTTDRAGVVPAFMIDWHGAFEQPWGYFSGSNALVDFASRISTAFGSTLTNMGPLSSGAVTEYGRNTLGCRLAITIEFGNNVTVSDAQYESFAVATAEALDGLIADDFFGIDCTTGTATASGFTASVFSPVNIECSTGAAVAAGWPAAIGSGIEIICAPGVAIAAGAPAVIGSAAVVAGSLGIGSASGYAASVSGGLAGMTLTEADIAAIAQAVATAVWSKILP